MVTGGFRAAKKFSRKVVHLYHLASDQLSKQVIDYIHPLHLYQLSKQILTQLIDCICNDSVSPIVGPNLTLFIDCIHCICDLHLPMLDSVIHCCLRDALHSVIFIIHGYVRHLLQVGLH